MILTLGYDERTPAGFHCCVASILARATKPVQFLPLMREALVKAGCYTRKDDDRASTGFAFTRFLTPWLAGYEGYSVFIDGADMIVLDDISKILDGIDPDVAVSVVQHPEYRVADGLKFWGAIQHTYPRKNWSSVMVFNNGHEDCQALTPEVVSEASGAWLHRFSWTGDVGELDRRWNVLIDEPDWVARHAHEVVSEARIIHYTRGIPGVPRTGPRLSAEDCQPWNDAYATISRLPDITDWQEHLKEGSGHG